MKSNHTLALIVAYFLSKYDDSAYLALGFSSIVACHAKVGRMLGVKPNSVKNMRDEFDPLHDNRRVGWYQRPLRPSRATIVETFQNLSEVELRDIVIEILTDASNICTSDFADIIESIRTQGRKRKSKPVFIVRGPTGRKAEKIFMEYYHSTGEPVRGRLLDMRDNGCGYDFEISNEQHSYQIEVKGLDGHTGGVSFTSKEWDMAEKFGNLYFLAIVRNVSTQPSVQIIQNPASVLSANKYIYPTVQVRWTLSDHELSSLNVNERQAVR